MSQHDFNIANQTFPSFRADLNDALVAAATMSAGSSAPTTPYAYQLWFDTTTGTWKVRNSGNTAWISTITTDLATGNVGIGTSPSQKLSILTSNGLLNIANGNTSNGTKIQSFVTAGNANGYLAFEGFDKEYARLDADGLKFNGDTAAANALDDYEEGALSLSSSIGTASVLGNRYTKIGNQVTVRFYVEDFSDLSTASAVSFTGLPYASSSNNQAVQGILGKFANTISGDAYLAYVGPSSSTLLLFKTANNANYSQIQHAHLTSASAQFIVTLTYETA